MFLGMSQADTNARRNRGTNEGTQLKVTTGWRCSDDTDRNGSNFSGFTALSGGYCLGNGGLSGQGCHGFWWSTTPIVAA